MKRILIAASAAGASRRPGPAARDQIRIVGSSTVYPFTTAVAESFGKASGMKTPVVESTGTGGGMKLFCAGVGEDHPDFTNASRAIKKSEFEDCAKNGVTDIVEIKVGFDGLTLANSKAGPDLDLTKQQIFMALAKEVPGQGRQARRQPLQDVERDRPVAAGHQDRSAGPAAHLRHPRQLRRTGDGRRAPKASTASKALKKADAKAFEEVWKSIREDGGYRRSRRERQPHRPEARSQSGCARHLRLLLPRGERRKIKGVADRWRRRRPTKPSPPATTRWPVRSSSTPRSSMSASSPAWRSSSPNTPPRRRIGEDGYLADKGLIALPGDQAEKAMAAAKDMTVLTADDLK